MKNLDWLSEKNTIKKLWIGFIFVLIITLVFQFFSPLDGHFKIEKFFGFAAFYGFFSCFIMIIIAKALGILLKVRENYYD
mgnify:FL=1